MVLKCQKGINKERRIHWILNSNCQVIQNYLFQATHTETLQWLQQISKHARLKIKTQIRCQWVEILTKLCNRLVRKQYLRLEAISLHREVVNHLLIKVFVLWLQCPKWVDHRKVHRDQPLINHKQNLSYLHRVKHNLKDQVLVKGQDLWWDLKRPLV